MFFVLEDKRTSSAPFAQCRVAALLCVVRFLLSNKKSFGRGGHSFNGRGQSARAEQVWQMVCECTLVPPGH